MLMLICQFLPCNLTYQSFYLSIPIRYHNKIQFLQM